SDSVGYEKWFPDIQKPTHEIIRSYNETYSHAHPLAHPCCHVTSYHLQYHGPVLPIDLNVLPRFGVLDTLVTVTALSRRPFALSRRPFALIDRTLFLKRLPIFFQC